MLIQIVITIHIITLSEYSINIALKLFRIKVVTKSFKTKTIRYSIFNGFLLITFPRIHYATTGVYIIRIGRLQRRGGWLLRKI